MFLSLGQPFTIEYLFFGGNMTHVCFDSNDIKWNQYSLFLSPKISNEPSLFTIDSLICTPFSHHFKSAPNLHPLHTLAFISLNPVDIRRISTGGIYDFPAQDLKDMTYRIMDLQSEERVR